MSDIKKDKQKLLYYFYVVFMNLSMVSMVTNLYFKYLGFSFTQIGILFGFLQIGKMVFEIPTGFIADRYGNRSSLLLSLALQMSGYLLMALIHSFSAMICILFLLAISYTLMTGCATAIITNRLIQADRKDELTQLNAVSRVLFYTCYGVAALAVGFLLEVGYELVFGISIVSLALAFLCIFFIEDESAHLSKKKQIRPQEAIRYIFQNPIIFYFSLVEAAAAWSMVPVDKFYNNYLHEHFGFPLSRVGIVISVQFIIVSFLGLYSSKLSQRINENILVRMGPVFMMIAFFLFALSENPVLAISMYFSGLAAFCLSNPVSSKLFQVNISSTFRVTVISFKSILLALLASVSQPLFGLISDKYEMRQAMMLLIAISFFFILAINLVFRKLNFTSEAKSEVARE